MAELRCQGRERDPRSDTGVLRACRYLNRSLEMFSLPQPLIVGPTATKKDHDTVPAFPRVSIFYGSFLGRWSNA